MIGIIQLLTRLQQVSSRCQVPSSQSHPCRFLTATHHLPVWSACFWGNHNAQREGWICGSGDELHQSDQTKGDKLDMYFNTKCFFWSPKQIQIRVRNHPTFLMNACKRIYLNNSQPLTHLLWQDVISIDFSKSNSGPPVYSGPLSQLRAFGLGLCIYFGLSPSVPVTLN